MDLSISRQTVDYQKQLKKSGREFWLPGPDDPGIWTAHGDTCRLDPYGGLYRFVRLKIEIPYASSRSSPHEDVAAKAVVDEAGPNSHRSQVPVNPQPIQVERRRWGGGGGRQRLGACSLRAVVFSMDPVNRFIAGGCYSWCSTCNSTPPPPFLTLPRCLFGCLLKNCSLPIYEAPPVVPPARAVGRAGKIRDPVWNFKMGPYLT
jgi:hypothetical protein